MGCERTMATESNPERYDRGRKGAAIIYLLILSSPMKPAGRRKSEELCVTERGGGKGTGSSEKDTTGLKGLSGSLGEEGALGGDIFLAERKRQEGDGF